MSAAGWGKRLVAGLTAATAWGAVGLQVSISSLENGILRGVWLDLLFFTVLTNILVAVVATRFALGREPRNGLAAATATYIAVVAIIYHVLLRHLWNPQGAQYVADILLHTVVPLLYWAFWLGFAPKHTLAWRRTSVWLLYPFAYFVYVLVRGLFTTFYPYPFVDVPKIGYSQVIVNALLIGAFFVLIGAIVIALDRWLSRRASRPVEA